MNSAASEHERALDVSADTSDETEYVPPQVESVLTAEDLAREIQHAGFPVS